MIKTPQRTVILQGPKSQTIEDKSSYRDKALEKDKELEELTKRYKREELAKEQRRQKRAEQEKKANMIPKQKINSSPKVDYSQIPIIGQNPYEQRPPKENKPKSKKDQQRDRAQNRAHSNQDHKRYPRPSRTDRHNQRRTRYETGTLPNTDEEMDFEEQSFTSDKKSRKSVERDSDPFPEELTNNLGGNLLTPMTNPQKLDTKKDAETAPELLQGKHTKY